MDRFSSPSLGSTRNARMPAPPCSYAEVVAFAPSGAGKGTGHAIGVFIIFAFFLIAAIGAPDSRIYLAIILGLSTILGCGMRLWHLSRNGF